MACCGYWGQEPSGESCPVSIPRTRPAIAVSNSGCATANWKRSCAYWLPNYKPVGNGHWKVHRCLLHRGKKRGGAVGPTKRGKGTKIVAICNDHSLPLAVSIQSASPHESQLVEETLAQSFLDELPARLIGDAAYDSDPLDAYLRKTYDVELIAPHKSNRKRITQDGRPFRRYRRRWCVERLFAWLHWFRRLVIRWEYHAENVLGTL